MATRNRIDVVDEAGQPAIVYEITEVIPAGTFADPHATIPGLSRYQLANGTPVNVVDGGFQVPDGMRYLKRT